MYNQLYSYFLPKFQIGKQELFELEIPKPDGNSRLFVFPSPNYLIDYHTIVCQLIASLPKNFHQVFEKYDYFFPFTTQRNCWDLPQPKDFTNVLYDWISDGYVFVLDVDIQDYFPSITPNSLYHFAKSYANVEILGWFCTKNGLIQGPPTSFWLAEYFLIPIDLVLQQQYPNVPFSRKLDNYRFLCKSESVLNEILIFLKEKLKTYGFLLNSNKIYIRQIQTQKDIDLEVEGRNVLRKKLLKYTDNQGFLDEFGQEIAIEYLENVCFQKSEVDYLDYKNKDTISMIIQMLPKNESYFHLLLDKAEDFLWWDLLMYAKKWRIPFKRMQDLSETADTFQTFKQISLQIWRDEIVAFGR